MKVWQRIHRQKQDDRVTELRTGVRRTEPQSLSPADIAAIEAERVPWRRRRRKQ